MVRSGSICAGMLPAAAWRANDANSSLKYVAGMGEASPPTQSDASLASVRWQYAKPFTPPLRRVMLQCDSGASKFRRLAALRHGRWVSRAGRPGTFGARQNLPLNLLIDPATLRACCSHLADHPPAVKPICTVWLTSTRALKLTHDRCPASSLTGGSEVRLLGGWLAADYLFDRVGRCAATPTARTRCPFPLLADHSHVPLSPLRCHYARSDSA